MIATGPVIETERLILRLPQPGDFDRLAEMMANEEAARFLGGAVVRSVAWRQAAALAGAWMLNGFSMFSVVEKATGLWVGRLGPWQPDGWPGTEVGWGLHPDAWGKGYATEGTVAAMDYAVDVLGWSEIIHCIVEENKPSQRVAERLGSRKLRQGRAPAPFEDIAFDIWGQSADEWRVNRRKFHDRVR